MLQWGGWQFDRAFPFPSNLCFCHPNLFLPPTSPFHPSRSLLPTAISSTHYKIIQKILGGLTSDWECWSTLVLRALLLSVEVTGHLRSKEVNYLITTKVTCKWCLESPQQVPKHVLCVYALLKGQQGSNYENFVSETPGVKLYWTSYLICGSYGNFVHKVHTIKIYFGK